MFEKIERFFVKKDEPVMDDTIRELSGCYVAMLATDGFEQSELFDPLSALEAAGATVKIISLKPGKIKAWNKSDWGKSVEVDMTIVDAFTEEFDFLVLPGGVINPDKLRIDDNAIAFVQSFVNSGKPIAAICHGPQTLIETGMVKGKTMTSWSSLKTDLTNAGAKWVDKEVVVDRGLITSRKPADIPAFNRAMIETFVDYHARTSLPNTEGFVATL